jgi:hypothetical protein
MQDTLRTELLDGRLGLFLRGELDDADALGAGALPEDLGELDGAGGLEELDEIVVGRRPRQLCRVFLRGPRQCERPGRTFLTKIWGEGWALGKLEVTTRVETPGS